MANGARRAEVCGVGIHPKLFTLRDGQAIRNRYGLGNFPVVGFVGRQDITKGVDVLAQAMKVVWTYKPEARLVLGGHCPPRPDRVDECLRVFNQEERARILRLDGFPEEEKASLYDAFDVFVLPSTEESFGIAFLEAWMCGKPVIGSRIGAIKCVIDEGVDGLLVDHRDPRDIGLKIVELLSDPAKRARMGRRGHQKTLERFTWEKVIDRVERVYQELAFPLRSAPQEPVKTGV
jgi:glycosyltransferase involved in cell wall biosynthesis